MTLILKNLQSASSQSYKQLYYLHSCIIFALRFCFLVILPCHSNPCQHSGLCIGEGTTSYSCDCSGTHYKGENCQIGIVTIAEIPILIVNQTSRMFISAYPDDFINITFIGAAEFEISPISVTITSIQNTVPFEITATNSGKFLLTYKISGPNAKKFENPLTYHIPSLDRSNMHRSNRYFTDVGSDIGLLLPGCCRTEYQCPSSDFAVSLSSICTWSDGDSNAHLADGIVFASAGSDLSLPVSIVGAEMMSANLAWNILPRNQLNCTHCAGSESQCYFYDLTAYDIADFLRSLALAKTFLRSSQDILPQWLSLSLRNSTLPLNTSFSLSDFYTTIAVGNDVKSIQGCERLKIDPSSLYSVLKLKHSITVSSNGDEQTFIPTATDSPVCFAVNLCQGLSSTLHMTIPESANDMLTLFDSVEQYIERGWDFTFLQAAVSHHGISQPISLTGSYWNGMTNFNPVIPKFDLRLEAIIRSELASENLWIFFNFSGTLHHQSNSTGLQVRKLLCLCTSSQ